MQKAAIPISCQAAVKLHQDAIAFAKKLENLLNTNEFACLMENLNGHAIPEPQLLIKDHEKKKNGHCPTRLIIPATNFAAKITKIGCLGVKKIFHDKGISYNKYTIQQASHLKEKLEKLHLRKNDATIMSLDVVNMYPSTKLLLIKKAFCYYARNLPKKDRTIINKCLKVIAFGMKTMLIFFQDRYYNYKGVVEEGSKTDNEDNNGGASNRSILIGILC
eukprot:15348099-Ditylum_brightwellii.AAC.1